MRQLKGYEFSATATPGFNGWLSPKHILDYPLLADDIVVIAYWNGRAWPDGARSVGYLTDKKDVMALRFRWSHDVVNAMRFETKDQAYEWLVGNNVSVRQDEVRTIGELKALVGYPTTPWRRTLKCA